MAVLPLVHHCLADGFEAPMAKLPLASQNQTRGNAFLFCCYSATNSPSTAWPRFRRKTNGNAIMNNNETRTNTLL